MAESKLIDEALAEAMAMPIKPVKIDKALAEAMTMSVKPVEIDKVPPIKSIVADDKKTSEVIRELGQSPKSVSPNPILSTSPKPQAAASAPPVKRKAGRPSKTPPIEKETIKGIVTNPIESANILELKIPNPIILKKFINMLNKYKCQHLNMDFSDSCVKIFAELDKTVQVRAYIEGSKAISYYVGDTQTKKIQLSRSNLEIGIKPIDNKTCSSICLSLDKTATFRMLAEYMVKGKLDHTEMSQCETFASLDGVRELDISGQPILKFTIPIKVLKPIISNIKKKSIILCIEKAGANGPVTLNFNDGNTTVTKIPFGVPENIQLESRVKNDDIYSASIRLGLVQHFISTAIFDDITILAFENGLVIFRYSNELWRIYVGVPSCR